MTRLPILRGVIRPLFPVAALGAAVAGQLELRADPHRGLVLYAVGLIALLASGAPALGGARRAWVERDARLKVRPVPLVAALLLAALAWLESGANRFTLLGVLAWVGATGSWLRAWWPGVESRGAQSLPDRPLSTDRSSRVWPLAPMLVVLLVAAFFRFHGLQQLPPEMTSDHAEKLFDVRDVLAGVHRIFFPRNTGREPAQFYLTALLAGPLGFGLNHMALKTGTAIIGWLTVPLTYAAARRGAGASR
ncbi:MAG TPA: hypothetical protein DEP84_16915, partial [Chloroflexi bacterium]|nr:hypothetical protein [Chloroflexota bacterium]